MRIAKNFGITRMRLVKPEIFDAYRIEGIAHNTADLVERIEFFDSLAEALADVTFAAVLTGRERAAKRRVLRPRDAVDVHHRTPLPQLWAAPARDRVLRLSKRVLGGGRGRRGLV